MDDERRIASGFPWSFTVYVNLQLHSLGLMDRLERSLNKTGSFKI